MGVRQRMTQNTSTGPTVDLSDKAIRVALDVENRKFIHSIG